ncbi:MAG: hypothetical protein U1F44_05170 [Coriobacteriia bacterium]|nr:hypothetical protein [Coriobacteriia bacterium]
MAEKTGAVRVPATRIRCPQCGLIAEGIRCPRCNSVKLVACAGSCRSCKTKCG